MVQAYLFALFAHFVSKLLADLQFTFFGPEAMAEIFQPKEIEEKKVEEEIENPSTLTNGNGVDGDAESTDESDKTKRSKRSNKKRSKMLDRLRRKRRRPKGKNRPFENGQTDSDSDLGK